MGFLIIVFISLINAQAFSSKPAPITNNATSAIIDNYGSACGYETEMYNSIQTFTNMLEELREDCQDIKQQLQKNIPKLETIAKIAQYKTLSQKLEREKNKLRNLMAEPSKSSQQIAFVQANITRIRADIQRMRVSASFARQYLETRSNSMIVQNVENLLNTVDRAQQDKCFGSQKSLKQQAFLSAGSILSLFSGSYQISAGIGLFKRILSLQGRRSPSGSLRDFSSYIGIGCALEIHNEKFCTNSKNINLFEQINFEAQAECVDCSIRSVSIVQSQISQLDRILNQNIPSLEEEPPGNNISMPDQVKMEAFVNNFIEDPSAGRALTLLQQHFNELPPTFKKRIQEGSVHVNRPFVQALEKAVTNGKNAFDTVSANNRLENQVAFLNAMNELKKCISWEKLKE